MLDRGFVVSLKLEKKRDYTLHRIGVTQELKKNKVSLILVESLEIKGSSINMCRED